MPRNVHDSFAMQQGARAIDHPDWEQGIYFLSDQDRAAIIAIHQLPVTLDTLWLRLLGRGAVQKRAIDELLALPKHHPYRSTTLRHITVLQKNLKARQNLTRDLQEVIMTLSITYEQIEAEIIEKGLQQGREEGRGETQQAIALRMLQEGMNRETVARLTGLPIAQLPTPEVLPQNL
jgi:predicted transposase/invertase (TIGR01784 family)